jgi:hypothetical protein
MEQRQDLHGRFVEIDVDRHAQQRRRGLLLLLLRMLLVLVLVLVMMPMRGDVLWQRVADQALAQRRARVNGR